ncbi:MAG: hypothetical protein K9N46_16540 [Candidatus Marinimicrobia bacterium]|nr:hypothetical protein [Candidatus Neomarinimicrobiota bacterium]MCF7829457.1 hypothetical protein [Candidatus Neomarinimicrobiota bacterium]MCF7882336.1 hypothetical protein [Candidatus Neomarinimicrobiota bacterium]
MKSLMRTLTGVIMVFMMLSIPLPQGANSRIDTIQAAEKSKVDKMVDSVISAVGSVCPGGQDMCATVTVSAGPVSVSATFYLNPSS